jgi:hypothetical protein
MATRIGAETYRHKYAFDFNGSTEYMASARDLFSAETSLSVSFWINTQSTNSLNRVVAQDALGGANRYWNCYYRDLGAGNRKMWFVMWDSGGTSASVSGSDGLVNDGNWHHVAVTYDGVSDFLMYVDGVFDVSGTTSTGGVLPATGSGSEIFLGSNGSWHFDGMLDEVAIWRDVVLSQDDITAIYNGGTPLPLNSYSPNIWYRMGDDPNDYWNGSEWTIIDNGYGGHNANLVSYNMTYEDRVEDIPNG